MTSTRTSARGVRVLVVEDDRHTAQLLCGLLEIAGFYARPLSDPSRVERVLLSEGAAVTVVSLTRRGIEAVTSTVGALRRRPEPALRFANLVAVVEDEFDLFFGLGTEANTSLVRPFSPQQLVDAVTEAAALGTDCRSNGTQPVAR